MSMASETHRGTELLSSRIMSEMDRVACITPSGMRQGRRMTSSLKEQWISHLACLPVTSLPPNPTHLFTHEKCLEQDMQLFFNFTIINDKNCDKLWYLKQFMVLSCLKCLVEKQNKLHLVVLVHSFFMIIGYILISLVCFIFLTCKLMLMQMNVNIALNCDIRYWYKPVDNDNVSSFFWL